MRSESGRRTELRVSAVWELYRRSDAARAILDRQSEIQSRLRNDKRKVWPVARVSRLFEISVRLLWRWISKGCINLFRRPTKHHRPGISANAIRSLLKQLHEVASYSLGYTKGRRRAAEVKCRAAVKALEADEELTPKEFATRARISQTTVHRLINSGFLYARRPTPHRKRICHPLTGRKTKKGH